MKDFVWINRKNFSIWLSCAVVFVEVYLIEYWVDHVEYIQHQKMLLELLIILVIVSSLHFPVINTKCSIFSSSTYSSLCLNLFHLLARKPNWEIFPILQITLDWAYCLFLAIAVVQITLDWAYCLFLAIAVFALTHLHLPVESIIIDCI
jgi:hypothetical protein